MSRYNDLMDGTVPPRRTKRLRIVDEDDNHLRWEEWRVDEDGYPTHPVDASEETPS